MSYLLSLLSSYPTFADYFLRLGCDTGDKWSQHCPFRMVLMFFFWWKLRGCLTAKELFPLGFPHGFPPCWKMSLSLSVTTTDLLPKGICFLTTQSMCRVQVQTSGLRWNSNDLLLVDPAFCGNIGILNRIMFGQGNIMCQIKQHSRLSAIRFLC